MTVAGENVRVLCISSTVGSLNSIRPEAECFCGLVKLGLNITVMTEGDSPYVERMRQSGVNIIDFAFRRKIEPGAIRTIRRTLIEGRYQVLHLFNNKAISNGAFASIGLPIKVVTYRGQTGNIKRYDPTCYLTHLHPRIDRITCVAESVRQDLIANGVPPDKLVTIYKGHDLSWYDNTPTEDLGAIGVPEGGFAIACVANNRPRKGVSVLIDAARHLPADTRVHILLIGNGMTSEQIQQLVNASRLPENFHLIDYRHNVLQLVASCGATVLPATKREGLPKTVIESMALGVAPIVTSTGGSPELVEDGVSGLVVDPNDARGLATAMQNLADHPELARRMGARARERLAERFTLEQGIEAHRELYTSLARELEQQH